MLRSLNANRHLYALLGDIGTTSTVNVSLVLALDM